MARRGKKKKGSGIVHKAVVVFTAVVVALCMASVGYGLFLRHAGGDGVPGTFRIEVLNGTGEDGLAWRVARAFMKRGIDVLTVENADSFSHPESVLIARKKNDHVWLLGELLGCSNVVEQLQPDAMVDATFIIGADYQSLKLGLEPDSGLLE